MSGIETPLRMTNSLCVWLGRKATGVGINQPNEEEVTADKIPKQLRGSVRLPNVESYHKDTEVSDSVHPS